jgi:hypothetical protein
MELPAFLNYYGDCSLGNHVCSDNELIANNSSYCNLTIPVGVTAKVAPAVTTVIYVSDTLFLNGTLSGSGQAGAASTASSVINHIGATGSGADFSYYGNLVQASNFVFNWTASNQPETLIGFGGTISIGGGNTDPGQGYCNYSSSGNSILASQLVKGIHFGLDISGGNGAIVSPLPSGQGGGGLYVLAQNVVYTGSVDLSGGSGISYNGNYWYINAHSGGGGGGSCVIRSKNVLSSAGSFVSIGGAKQNSCPDLVKGGDGAMIIVTD